MSAPTQPASGVQHNASARSFGRNVIFGYLATFTSLLSGLIVTPVVYRNLGTDGFAAFALVNGIAGFALMADLGVGTSTVRRIAAAVAIHDDRALWATIRASRRLLRISAGLSLLALAVVAWRMPELFGVPAGYGGKAQLALLIVAIGQSLYLAFSTPSMVLIGHGRADLLAKRSAVLGAAAAAGQVVVVTLGGGLVGLSIVVAATSLLTAGIGQLLQRRLLADRPSHGAELAPREVRDILGEGLLNFAISLCGAVAFGADTIVLGALAPFAAITVYAVAAKLPALIRIFSSKAMDLLQPTYSHFRSTSGQHDPAILFTVLARTTKLSLATGISLGLGVCCSSRLLFDLWLGRTPDGAERVLYLLLAGTVLQMSGHAIYVLLTGIRQLRPLLIFSAASAAANIGLSTLLTTQLEASGPALASLICVTIGDLIALPLLTASTLGLAPWRMIRELTLLPVLPVVPAVALALLLHVPTQSPWSVAVGSGCVVVYLAGFWSALGRADREYARTLVGRALAGRLRRGSVPAEQRS